MAFKNPFSKKNTFWYGKFAFILNQVDNAISKVSETTNKIASRFNVGTNYNEILYDNTRIIMQEDSIKVAVVDTDNVTLCGFDIDKANDKITVTAGGQSYEFNAANIGKLNSMVIAVTLTQAEYDALATKDPYTLYIISDAQ